MIYKQKTFQLCGILMGLAVVASQYSYAATSRIALVIGNANYDSIQPLINPVRDATKMTRSLRKLGFKVIYVENANQDIMERAFRFFGQQLRKASKKSRAEDNVALFYYSGHGAQYNGNNYLISVDAAISSNRDQLFKKTNNGIVPLTSLYKEINAVDDTMNIFILDACRDNPLIAKNEEGEGYMTRNIGKGLQWAEVMAGSKNEKEPKNSIFGYATARGEVADDGYGVNSPYTRYLLENIEQPGLDVDTLFDKITNLVKDDPSTNQIPSKYSSLYGKKFYFAGKGKEETPEIVPNFGW